MKIRVTRDDIRKGKTGSYNSCPIALAVKRAVLPEFKKSKLLTSILGGKSVVVGAAEVSIGTKQFANSTDVEVFIDSFDTDRKSVLPFTLELDFDANEARFA